MSDEEIFEREISKAARGKIEVYLVNWTPNPIKTVYWALRNQHFDIPASLDDIHLTKEEETEFVEMLIKQHHTSVLEYINMVFLIKGASRAFQQQLTRTRQASYSIQSLRIVDVGNFAAKELYHIPEKIKANKKLLQKFKGHMRITEKTYRELIEGGANPEDARGILPLNIHSPITMSINMRSFIAMMENRMCLLAQGEFREVAAKMRLEVCKKIHPSFAKALVPPCVKTGKCPMIIHCGKMNYPQANPVDVSKWIKDKIRRDEHGRYVKDW